MNEARLGYLCTQAATDRITFSELSELLDYAEQEPEFLNG